MSAANPLSVVLPAELRKRLVAEAKRRGLPLSTAVRTLVAERVRQLDEAAELTAAELWQRERAWGTWEQVRAGDAAEVTTDDLTRDIEAAKTRNRRRRP
jgi:hypothetical protein